MGQNAPHYQLEKLPPLREKVETVVNSRLHFVRNFIFIKK